MTMNGSCPRGQTEGVGRGRTREGWVPFLGLYHLLGLDT